ncbi:MAG: UDP-N-acetylglucosamine 1-carboxyvinyltransferase [Deferribacteraceae bacterium]|jgi:UDP-N-acetylglucosamine 1-carboxyvinyltransferase|nr:UDP-N-acetylglucosamine 1-carboxyvinyltransferase [Deferribacteraceae bacterium]
MEKLIINGGNRLNGRVRIGGAKNAALPILAATILAEGEYRISGLPMLTDICTMGELLAQLNISTSCSALSRFCGRDGISTTTQELDSSDLLLVNNDNGSIIAPFEIVNKMRASILVLGAILAKRKQAKVALPGGCAIGERPVDLHISALEAMGATISVNHGYIEASCDRLKGAEFTFRVVTVTGTENILMAATLAEGVTVLNNAAKEPEVVDLANFLVAMGAKIKGIGTSRLEIEGVERLHSANYTVMPDRIEAGTFLCAVAGTGGRLEIENIPVDSMEAVLLKLQTAGLKITIVDDRHVIAESDGKMRNIDIETAPYPSFPTDMQAQFMAIMTKADGDSIIDETIFENRFMHAAELKRMGANITLKGNRAKVRGVKELSGAEVTASDLRASAGLVIAALMASNTSEVHKLQHLDRGYEAFEQKLKAVGADIVRVKVAKNNE